jgi:hypothetical protein
MFESLGGIWRRFAMQADKKLEMEIATERKQARWRFRLHRIKVVKSCAEATRRDPESRILNPESCR